jgi:hypothetical protein
MVLTISLINGVDLPIFFLLRGPLAARLKKSNPGLGSLYAYICNCEQISHHLVLLQGDRLHSLDITNFIVKSIDDLNVLNVRDSIPDFAEALYIVPETLIVLLLDSLHGLSCRWMLVHALKVLNEHDT